MAGIPAVAFAGYSGAGKTTIIEALIPLLRERGLRVGVVKHDGHGFEIDREGKDSWRFSRAGADCVVLASPQKTVYMEGHGCDFSAAASLARGVDILLVEGYKQEGLTQIGVSRRACGKGLPAGPERYVAIVTDDQSVKSAGPRFKPGQTKELAEFIMKNNKDFTHFNADGRVHMVDVGDKAPSRRTAEAAARVCVSRETLALIQSGGMKKGDVLTAAQLAGVMGAKRTADLIPLCHPVALDGADLRLWVDENACAVEIRAAVRCEGRTGVEMEALTAVTAAALTVYDMCKAVQKDITITDVRLLRKTGGKHGDFYRGGEV